MSHDGVWRELQGVLGRVVEQMYLTAFVERLGHAQFAEADCGARQQVASALRTALIECGASNKSLVLRLEMLKPPPERTITIYVGEEPEQ